MAQAGARGAENLGRLAAGVHASTAGIPEADRALGDYASFARGLAHKKIMGVRGGTLVAAANGGVASFIENVRARLGLAPAAMKERVLERRNTPWEALSHYRQYTDPGVNVDALKAHHYRMIFDDMQDSDGAAAHLSKDPVMQRARRSLHEGPLASLPEAIAKVEKHSPALAKAFSDRALTVAKEHIPKPGTLGVGGVYGEIASRFGSRLARGARGLRNVALPAALLAGGIGAYKKLKKTSADNDTASWLLAGGAGGVVGGGTLAAQGVRGVLNPNRRIAVTYGSLPSIGEGHRQPGMAIKDLLQQDPRFSKYKVEGLERLPNGLFPGEPGQFAAAIHTGFGSHVDDWADPIQGRVGGLPTDFRSARNMAYQTDMTGIDGSHTYSSARGLLRRDSPWYKKLRARILGTQTPAGNSILHYGPHAGVLEKETGLKAHTLGEGVTPALNDEGVQFLQEAKQSRQDILNHIIKGLEGSKDPYDLEQLRKLKGIKDTDRVITVAGAGRGDYAHIRSRELAEAIAKDPELKGKVKILSLNAGAYGGPQEKLLHGFDDVVSLGKLMPVRDPVTKKLTMHPYAQLQSLSDLNWGATGTSGLHEQLLGKNIQAVPTEWGSRENGGRIIKGTIADRLDKALDRLGIKRKPGAFHADVGLWNKGNMEHARGLEGVVKGDTAEDILSVLKNPEHLSKLRSGAASRAATQGLHYERAKKNLLDTVLREAKAGTRGLQGRAGLLGLLGLATAGGGVAMIRKSQQKPESGGAKLHKRLGL